MRAPRYRFPEQVRSATREMAARMIEDESIARSPEQMEAWIAESPQVRSRLEEGGYGTEFTAADLFPLLRAMLGDAALPAPAPNAAAAPEGPRRLWLAGLLLLIALAAAVLLIV